MWLRHLLCGVGRSTDRTIRARRRPMKRLVVLISGRGSNLAAILDRQDRRELGGGEVVGVISIRAEAPGLEHARRRGIPTEVVNHREYSSRKAFDAELAARIDCHEPDLVVLAGFMRILTADFTRAYEGRLINTHPSLLPRFPGVDAIGQALAAGVSETGCSVHFVTPVVDGGPVIDQRRVSVEPGDSREQLEKRVLAAEHKLLPDVITVLCSGQNTVP